MSTETPEERCLWAAKTLAGRIAGAHARDAERAFNAFAQEHGARPILPLDLLLLLWGGYFGSIVVHMTQTFGLKPSFIVEQLALSIREMEKGHGNGEQGE